MKVAGTCLKTKHLHWQIQDFSGGGVGMWQKEDAGIYMYYFGHFPRKLHETEKKLDRAARVPSAPLNL